jgi:hypothetical protein
VNFSTVSTSIHLESPAFYYLKSILLAPDFPDHPYTQNYLDVLGLINSGQLEFEDVRVPESSEGEHYARILKEGIQAKRHTAHIHKRPMNVERSNLAQMHSAAEKMQEIVSNYVTLDMQSNDVSLGNRPLR